LEIMQDRDRDFINRRKWISGERRRLLCCSLYIPINVSRSLCHAYGPSNWHSIRRNWTHCFVTLVSADFIRTGNTALDRGSTSDRPRYHKRYQLVCLSSRNQTSNLKYWRAIFETYAHTKTRSVVSWFNRGSKYQRSSWVGSTPRVGLGWVGLGKDFKGLLLGWVGSWVGKGWVGLWVQSFHFATGCVGLG